MALTERSRAALFRGLSDVLDDEEAVAEMLSYFPARDVDEPASRDFVDARIANLEARSASVEARMAAGFEAVDARFASVEARMATGFEAVDARFASVEARMAAGFEAVDARFASVDARFEAVDARFASLEARMQDGFASSDATMRGALAEVRREVKADLHAEIQVLTRWAAGLIVSIVGLTIALGVFR